MKSILFLFILLLCFGILTMCTQNYSCKIVYDHSLVKVITGDFMKDLSICNQIGQDSSIVTLYIKKNRFRVISRDVKTNHLEYIYQYEPVENRFYACTYSYDSIFRYAQLDESKLPALNTLSFKNDTIYILNKKCQSVTIKDTFDIETIFFTNAYKFSKKSIGNRFNWFTEYIRLTGAIPLMVVSRFYIGKDWEVYKVKEIKKGHVSNDIFRLPKSPD